jgi:hypothetical protein
MESPSNDIWFEGPLFVKNSRFSDFNFTFNIFSHLVDMKHQEILQRIREHDLTLELWKYLFKS